jgi:hypothetical protein
LVGCVQPGVAKIGAGPIGVLKLCPRQGRKAQTRFLQMGAGKFRAGEICVLEQGAAEIRFGKIGAGETRVVERGMAEIGGREFGLFEPRIAKVAAVAATIASRGGGCLPVGGRSGKAGLRNF